MADARVFPKLRAVFGAPDEGAVRQIETSLADHGVRLREVSRRGV